MQLAVNQSIVAQQKAQKRFSGLYAANRQCQGHETC